MTTYVKLSIKSAYVYIIKKCVLDKSYLSVALSDNPEYNTNILLPP